MKTKIFLSEINKKIKSDYYIKYVLNKYFDYNFDEIFISKKANGKPYLENINLKYSVSHKANHIVAIVSDREIGIDMEIINNKNYLKIADKYFLKEEINYIEKCSSNLEKNIRFLEIWTKKEAYIKKNDLNLSYLKKINTLKEKIFTVRISNFIISICD